MDSTKSFIREPKLPAVSLLMEQQVAAYRGALPIIAEMPKPEATTADSIDYFCVTVQYLLETGPLPLLIEIRAVQLQVGGRSSQFDMSFFPATNATAVLDIHDAQFVGILQ